MSDSEKKTKIDPREAGLSPEERKALEEFKIMMAEKQRRRGGATQVPVSSRY